MQRSDIPSGEKRRLATTRRNVLKGMLGVGAAGLATLGTREAAAAVAVPTKWDMEADVVVIGSGFAGLSVAITAHDAGAKVLLLEKAPEQFKGGNSRVCGQVVYWPENSAKNLTYMRTMMGSYTDNIPEDMLNVWLTEMQNNKAWLVGMGMVPNEFPLTEFPQFPGSDGLKVLMHGNAPGGAHLYDDVIAPQFAKRKIEALYETPAVRLVKRDDEIVGVVAEKGGKPVNIKANRAVVMTCGGFENNMTMVRNYLTGMTYCAPYGTPYNTGDGIRMAEEVGADLWHMNNVAGPYYEFRAPNMAFSSFRGLRAGGMIYVGPDGSRFTKESWGILSDVEYHGKQLRHGQWIQNPTPNPIHMVFDETVRAKGPLIGKATGAFMGWEMIHGNLYQWSNDNTAEIAKGWIKKAGTIAELATAIGINAAALQATVDRFNGFAQTKKDLEFGRPSGTMAPIHTPPYYAMLLTPTLLNTQGGPRRNKEAQVLDTQGQPIPRLFSAGELGSIYAFNYQGGGNIGECFAFGRIAGRNAAAQKPWA